MGGIHRSTVRVAAVLAALISAAAFNGSAKADDLVVATFGGSFADDTKTCNIQPLPQPTSSRSIFFIDWR